MKRALLLAGAMVAAVPAWAEWTLFEMSSGLGGTRWYMDRNAPRASNSQIKRAWLMKDSTEADKDGDLSSKGLYEFDCPEQRFRILQVNYFKGQMGNGGSNYSQGEPGPWRYIPPESIMDSAVAILCGKR